MELIEPEVLPDTPGEASPDEVVRLRGSRSIVTVLLLGLGLVLVGTVGSGLAPLLPEPGTSAPVRPASVPTPSAAAAITVSGESAVDLAQSVQPAHSEVDLYREILIVYLRRLRDECEARARG